jgi:hypothetical protein
MNLKNKLKVLVSFSLSFVIILLVCVTSFAYFKSNSQNKVSAVALTTNQVNFSKKVYLLVYDPVFNKSDGTTVKMHEYFGWNDPYVLTNGIINTFQEIPSSRLNYSIVLSEEKNEFPVKADGFVYNQSSFEECWNNRSLCHSADTVDYENILSTHDVCGKLNRGEIDELWMYGFPYAGFYESALGGKDGFSYNGGVFSNNSCNKLIPIMGFNFERGLGEAIHDFGHRTEATMTKVYGGWSQNSTTHNWNKFGLVKAQSPNYTYSGCGSVHFPPNASSTSDEYKYNLTTSIPSNCNDFYNYPNITNSTALISCSAWSCTDVGYYKWWFSHIPNFEGIGPDGALNDWWEYIANPNVVTGTDRPLGVIPASSLTFSNVSATFEATQATFNFSSPYFSVGDSKIDMSTVSDMSTDVYFSFATGASPVSVLNPQTKWDKYRCGATLYWRVLDAKRSTMSLIQTTTINCTTPTASPTLTQSPTPTRTPTPTPQDIIAPKVQIKNPINGSKLLSTVKISTSASDASGISKIDIYLDTKLVKSCLKQTTCEVSTSTSSLAKGTHTIKANAYDNSINKNLGTVSISVTK